MANLQILNQLKSNSSCIKNALLIILYVNCHVMMIMLNLSFMKFVNLTLIQGQNSNTTEASQLKIII